MAAKSETNANKWDVLKWLLVLLLIVVGFAANYYYIAQPLPLRLAGWIILVIIAAAIALQTSKGRQMWRFAKESRNEIRRVVWPNRRETVQITFIVIVIIIVTALILWGIDSFLLWAVTWITGQRG